MKWHDRKKESPKAPIDKNGYLCRCVIGEGNLAFYMVLCYIAVDEYPHFQHELTENDLKVTHWAKIKEPKEV